MEEGESVGMVEDVGDVEEGESVGMVEEVGDVNKGAIFLCIDTVYVIYT